MPKTEFTPLPQKQQLKALGFTIRAAAEYLGRPYCQTWRVLNGRAQSNKLVARIDTMIRVFTPAQVGAEEQVYRKLRERYDTAPETMDTTDKALLVLTGSVKYIDDYERYSDLYESFCAFVEERIKQASDLIDDYEHDKYQGDAIYLDYEAIIPEELEDLLDRLHMLDLGVRIGRLVQRLNGIYEKKTGYNDIPLVWPFSPERLERAKRELIERGEDPNAPGFEEMAMKRATMQLAMGTEAYDAFERREREGGDSGA